MANSFTFVSQLEWAPGDYRYGATFSAESIEVLASRFSASIHSFVEPGLGPARCFALRMRDGRQVAIEQYEDKDVNLIVLFENGRCSITEIRNTLAALKIPPEAIKWLAPEAE